jgi:prevent-host-death family protein
MRTVTIEEARAKLGDVVDHARLADEPTLITRYGRPAAVVVGAEWYHNAEECLAGPGGTSIGPSGGRDDH